MLSKNIKIVPFSTAEKLKYRPQLFRYKYNTCLEKPKFSDFGYDPDTMKSLQFMMLKRNNKKENIKLNYGKNNIKIDDNDIGNNLKNFRKKYIQNDMENDLDNDINYNLKTDVNEYKPDYGIKYISKSQQVSLPQWLKFDKKVLRFYGYFNEPVQESAYETWRINKCTLLYYLEDDTVQIYEEKNENSGITQGQILSRQRITDNNQNNKELTWKDLNLSQNILIYGKIFRICSCDSFTSEFYLENGIKMNQPEKIPEIDFSNKYKMVDFNKIRENIMQIKEFTEVGLGGGHPNGGLKDFLSNSGAVLSFDISWFDDNYDKEEKMFKMNYYLSDNKIEICEINEKNSGKYPFPLLLSKEKIPKKPKFSFCPGMEENNVECYQPKDLITGNYINVYGRKCRIIGCDEFTKNWYKKNLGINMESIKLKQNPPQNIVHPIPPHNNFGSEEDSILNVKFLDPRGKIKESITKKFRKDKHILRFLAKLISHEGSNEERRFLISFFVRDDSIQVFEIAGKNSGRRSCKFFEKQRIKNPYTKKYYTEKDMVIGNLIYINSYIFKLIECDEYTKKYMISNKDIFVDSDINSIIERIRLGSWKFNEGDISDFLVHLLHCISSEGNDWVDYENIKKGLIEMGVSLSEAEICTLLGSLRKNSEGKYSLEDFYNIVKG